MKEWRRRAGNVRNGFCIAVSMYSRLPVPAAEWTKEGLAFALCFFPVVGVFIGAAELAWWYLARYLSCGDFLTGAVGALLPVFITGGIHMDGYMDTADARNSYGSTERRLEILKDSHLGAFAVIRFGSYLLLYAALYAELRQEGAILLAAMGFVVSRAWSAIAFVTLEKAKSSGTLYEFAAAADKRAVLSVSVLVIVILSAAGARLSPIAGSLFALVPAFVFFYYRKIAYREFGGITGDLAGYFLQLCELAILAAAVFY